MKKVDPDEARKLDALLKKIEIGDGLTDDELARAIKFFSDIEWRLRLLGPHFHLAWKDVYFKLQRFEGYFMTRNGM